MISSTLPLPSTIPFTLQLFGEIFGSNTWLVNRPEKILFRTKDPSSDVVIVDFRHVCPLDFLTRNMSHCHMASLASSSPVDTMNDGRTTRSHRRCERLTSPI